MRRLVVGAIFVVLVGGVTGLLLSLPYPTVHLALGVFVVAAALLYALFSPLEPEL